MRLWTSVSQKRVISEEIYLTKWLPQVMPPTELCYQERSLRLRGLRREKVLYLEPQPANRLRLRGFSPRFCGK